MTWGGDVFALGYWDVFALGDMLGYVACWGACVVLLFDVIMCCQGVLHSVFVVVVQGNIMFFF